MRSANEQWLFPELRAFILQPPQSSAREHETGQGSNSVVFRTPSLMQSQIPWLQELQYRRSTCAFVADLAAMVEIPESPAITAQLYVQRFYMLHSFAQHDRFLVATAALFLAAKTEEFPVKVRLMTECALYLLVCPVEAAATLASHSRGKNRTSTSPTMDARKRKMSPGHGGDPSQQPQPTAASKDPEALKAKHLKCLNALLNTMDVGEVEQTSSRVLLLERIILQTLAFEIGSPQPFAYVAPAMELVFALEAMHPSISYPTIRLCAYLLLADAIKHVLCLAFNPKTLAIGAVYLSCIHRHQVGANVATQNNEPWWTVWGLSAQELHGKSRIACRIAAMWLYVLISVLLLADVARGMLWMYENAETGRPLPGLSASFQELWELSDPQKNVPDVEYIKKLDSIIEDRK